MFKASSNTEQMLGALTALRTPSKFPMDLVQLPTRVHTLCQEQGWATLEDFISHLGDRDYGSLVLIPGFGKKAASEVGSFLRAIRVRDIAGLRRHLPLDKAGKLSLNATLHDITAGLNPAALEMMLMRFKEKTSTAEVAQHFQCSREFVRQLEEFLFGKLDKALSWFGEERRSLWEEWESTGAVSIALKECRLDSGLIWLSEAVALLFKRSASGVELENRLDGMFRDWATELVKDTLLGSSGVLLHDFVNQRSDKDYTNRFEQWLKENLNTGLVFSRKGVKVQEGGLTNKEQQKLYPKMLRAKRWQDMYGRLKDFHATHGHSLVPAVWNSDPKLGIWVSMQRQRRKTGTMSKEQIRLLEKVGFAWRLGKGRRQSPKY